MIAVAAAPKTFQAQTDSSFFSGKHVNPSPVNVRKTTVTRMVPATPPRSTAAPNLPSSVTSSPLSAPPDSPPKKRKAANASGPAGKRARVSPGADAPPKPPTKPAAKKPKKKRKTYLNDDERPYGGKSSSAYSCSPEPLYRSRSSTSFGRVVEAEKRDWSSKSLDNRFDYSQHLSSANVVHKLVKKYQTYFKGPDDASSKVFAIDAEKPPKVELEYPAIGATEEFILYAPKDKDHYNPFFDLEKSLYTIIEYYIPKHEREVFGHIPTLSSEDDPEMSDAHSSSPHSRASSKDGRFDSGLASQQGSSPLTQLSKSTDTSSALTELTESSKLSSLSSMSSRPLSVTHPTSMERSSYRDDSPSNIPPRPHMASLWPLSSSPVTAATSRCSSPADSRLPSRSSSIFPSYQPRRTESEKRGLLRKVQRAINKSDGPGLTCAMKEINEELHRIKMRLPSYDCFDEPTLTPCETAVQSWYDSGLPKDVLMRIIEENYQRSVGPNVLRLKQYEAFSSTVYGELMPSFVYNICKQTGLRQDSLFMDLGSGVGNVVVQAALQTGCRSFGVELMHAPAQVAAEMKEPFEARCRMWGLRCGDIELVQGNFLDHPRVNELMREVDVVLVDNKVFDQQLNEQLRPKFLDLKEGAIVISLKPFVASLNARFTERNVDDISAIFDVSEHPYYSGDVSWGSNGGMYYIHRVDRKGYAEIRTKFENSRRSTTRRR